MNTLNRTLFLIFILSFCHTTITAEEEVSSEVPSENAQKAVFGSVVIGGQSIRACKCRCGVPNEPGTVGSSINNAITSIAHLNFSIIPSPGSLNLPGVPLLSLGAPALNASLISLGTLGSLVTGGLNSISSFGSSLFGTRVRDLPVDDAEVQDSKPAVLTEDSKPTPVSHDPKEEEESEKLIGGDLSTDSHILPWMAAIIVNSSLVGGGVLISDSKVLTAASLFQNVAVSSVTVSLGLENICTGDSGSSNQSISAILANPQFNPNTSAHDLAILTLANVVNFGPNLRPICLSKLLFSQYVGQQVLVASWGGNVAGNSTCRPRRIRLPILTPGECRRSVTTPSLLTPDKDCLGVVGSPSSVCSTDIGYPVQYRDLKRRYQLIGIVAGKNVCGSVNSTLQVRIQDHLPWIKLQIASDCTCNKF